MPRPVHETHLEIPFPVEQGLAVIRVPREGLTPEDAQRMADMLATLPANAASDKDREW